MNQTALSIIIVSWNVKKLLKKCLDSIFENQGALNLEIFVIDNNSSDGTGEEIKKLSPSAKASGDHPAGWETRNLELKVIANKKNVGFARANDQGIKEARGEFVLLLNPDTEVGPCALETMVKFMREYPECGVAGCRLLNPDGTIQPSVRRFPDFWSQAMILLKFHHLFPNAKPIKKYFAKDFDYADQRTSARPVGVDQVMGAFFLIRREVIEKIGTLDEKFYIWFEEVDFCKRAKDAGWQVCYAPETEIIHHGAQSFNQIMSFKKQKMFNKSLLYYFKKHKPRYQWLLLLVLQPISIILSLLVGMLEKNNRVIK